MFLALPAIDDLRQRGRLTQFADEECHLIVALRPGDLLAPIAHTTDAAADGIVVGAVDHRLGVVHQFEFLHTLLLHRAEVLLMGGAEAGEHADGGLDDVAQGVHLARLGDARLEDTDLRLLIEQPDGEGHADLRVVTAGRADDLLRGQQQLIEPLLDHRLAVGAGDADHGHVELVAMTLSQPLQGGQRRGHHQEVGILHPREFIAAVGLQALGLDHVVAHASPIEVDDVAMAVVAGGREGEEQRLLRETKRAAVSEQPAYLCIGLADTTGTNEGCNLFNRVIHLSDSFFRVQR